MHSKRPKDDDENLEYTIQYFKYVYDIEYDPDCIDPRKVLPLVTKRMGMRRNCFSDYEYDNSHKICDTTPKNNRKWRAERRIYIGSIEFYKEKFNLDTLIIGNCLANIEYPSKYFKITKYLEKKFNVDPKLIDIDIEIEKYSNGNSIFCCILLHFLHGIVEFTKITTFDCSLYWNI